MNMRLRLSHSDLLSLSGIPYRPVDVQHDFIILEQADRPGITQSFTHEEVAALLGAPDTRFTPGYYTAARARLRQTCPVDLFSELDGDVRSVLLWQKAACDAFLLLEQQGKVKRTYRAVKAALPILEHEAKKLDGQKLKDREAGRAGALIVSRKFPCAKSILRWVRLYEKGGLDALALLPRWHRCGNRGLRWCHASEAFAYQIIDIYASAQRPTKDQAIAETLNRFKVENLRRLEAGLPPLTVPSSRSLHRRLQGVDQYYLYAKRYGIDAANRKYRLIETGVEVLVPGERVEMDEHRLDVISFLAPTGVLAHLPADQVERLKGRRWLYLAIDCATKCILAIRLAETPNAQDAIRTLRDIFVDRTPYARAAGCESAWDQRSGIGALVTDQGSAFMSADFRATATSLGLTMHFPPAGMPHLRGTIETMFRTIGYRLMPLLSGRTFFNPVDRGDYPSEQLACLDDDDLIRVLLTYFIDIYHNEPQRGLRGETPADCWKRLSAAQGLLPIPDGLTLRKVFGRPLIRKIRGDGVLFAGLSYNCAALREMFLHAPERDVEIRADLFDLGWIAVKVGDGWHAAICNHRGFDGVRYTDWQEACRALRIKHQRAATLSEEVVHRAIARISDTNRAAALRMQLTPFQVTDAEVARNEKALHYSLTTSAGHVGDGTRTGDPLADGIDITPIDLPAPSGTTAMPPPAPRPSEQPVTPRKSWTFDDEAEL
ncbi:Mu transposase C-terminal domain-containing protein [Rhodobacter sp. 24-YEA-8]|uniref:Mu transposase C-terminal domain-containing protein n=1 Tax=Rhodobacter sp. 24-YEA-8 TaxID=1884310 RepID=UPI00089D17D9|nr:Mu transposase C-terminal domain-containing protein [Rhodobacter sp. 24-YEA-8]SEC39410.1 Mu transposase, C-terminal [Rhodobacter sp. 24-YEA-8]